MLSLFKNRQADLQKDIAFFTLGTIETIIHLPLEKMLVVAVERIKNFFQTEYACIHFYPNLGLNQEIINYGLLSCPLAKVPMPIQQKLIEVENKLNHLSMSTGQIIKHQEIFQVIPDWNQFDDYFNFSGGVTIPLIYQSEVFGALDIYHQQSTPLSKAEVGFLNTLGSCLYGAVKREVFIRDLLDRDDLIEAFAKTIEANDYYTGGHVDRVKDYAIKIGQEVGLSLEELKTLKRAALLHDVGKIGVPENILNKPGPLSIEERKIIETHPLIAQQIFASIQEGPIKKSMDGILYHHERIDGQGYPNGLKGQEIPLMARIIAIADTFDALTSDRPYRRGMDTLKAISILESLKDNQLDGTLVEVFLAKQLFLS